MRPVGTLAAVAAVMSDQSDLLTWQALEVDSVRVAHLLRSHGLNAGDRVAILMGNTVAWFSAVLGIRRANMMFVPVNWHLHRSEIHYVLDNSESRAIITTDALLDLAAEAIGDLAGLTLRLTLGEGRRGFINLGQAIAAYPATPPPVEMDGGAMLYSSGTSGRPKGIIRPRPEVSFRTPTAVEALLTSTYDLDENTVYLCPAPLYHAAPIGWTVAVLLAGGTVVVASNFSAKDILAAIERFHVTHVQFVPTHMIRLLKLPEQDRKAHDLSSLSMVIHAAAPCPPDIKRQFIAWFGPIVYEYYSGSEGCGFTDIDSQDWLAHPGSVGKSRRGLIHIIDPDTGNVLPPGDIGLVFFELGEVFRYHKDPEKTRACFSEQGWGTHGDLGRVDEEGYLYLSDRLTNLIISGGVNIYPQEVENVLINHPAVADVAVIGVPNEEFGEELKAVIELAPAFVDYPPAPEVLIAYCKQNLASFKCPRSVDFIHALPRHPNGKLLKRVLKARYWPAQPADSD